MAKFIEKDVLQVLLTKIVSRNDARYLMKGAEAASAAKVKNAITINGETFDGSEAKSFSLSTSDHKHTSTDITDFKAAVEKVITDAGGTSHTHTNKAALDLVTEGKIAAWDAKISVDDVAKLKYTNAGMTSVADVKGALDVLVKNVQIGNVALADATANVNGLATRLTQAEKDIDALETTVGNADSGLVKKVADLEEANAEGGAVANAIADAKKAGTDAQAAADAAAAAVVTEKGRAEGKEAELQGAIDAINNVDSGILAQAKAYADQKDTALDGKITTAKAAADAAQGDVDALELVVGNKTDLADADTVFGKIAKAQAQADKGVQDAATEKLRAEGVEQGLRADLGNKTDTKDADGSAFARIAQVKADLAAEVTRADAAEKAVDAKVDAAQDAIDILNGADTVEGSVDKKIKDAIATVNTAAGNLEGRVKANEDAIAVIQGEGDGSIKKAVADLVDSAPGAMDTLGELAQAISDHQDVYTGYVETVNGQIATAKQEAITEAGTNADAKDQALHETITGEIATAKSEAISAAAQDATSKDTALENKLQANIDKKVDQTAYDTKIAALEKADTDNLAAAKAYADAEDKKIEDTIGTADDLASANTVYGKIKALQEKDASQDGVIATKAAAADLDALEALVGTVGDTKDDATAFGKIAAEVDRATAAESALDTRLGTAEGKITALEGKVGDATNGLVKDVADLKSTVGDASNGLVKDVADLKAKDTALDGKISSLEAKDTSLEGSINDNAADIADLQGRMTDAEGIIEGHTTSITTLTQFMNNHGQILESELDAMLDAAYGVTQQ